MIRNKPITNSFLITCLIIFMFILGLSELVLTNKESNVINEDINCIATRPLKIDDNCIASRPENIEEENNKEIIAYLGDSYPNQVGSIYIDGTSISNVIMQATDNDYYLNHAPDGSYDVLGSIFMDYRNTINDKKILLFGHNSKKMSGSPFHDLEKYTNYDFYKEHPYINLTLGNTRSKWEIFSVMIVSNTTNKHMKLKFSDTEWNEHIDWMINRSIYNTGIKVENSDRIITLQTCYYNEPETFLIISAKKV